VNEKHLSPWPLAGASLLAFVALFDVDSLNRALGSRAQEIRVDANWITHPVTHAYLAFHPSAVHWKRSPVGGELWQVRDYQVDGKIFSLVLDKQPAKPPHLGR
jgi:hypothetical protein